jgi:hypothetical protein
MGMPRIDSRSIECGSTIEIEALDEHGDPVTYRVTARVPSAGAGQSPESGQDAGESTSSAPSTGVPLAPTIGHSFEAMIVGSDLPTTPEDVEDVRVFFNQDVVPGHVAPGERLDVHLVTLRQVQGHRIVFDLPASLRHEDGTDLTLLLGLD